jgi:hypothetical protein
MRGSFRKIDGESASFRKKIHARNFAMPAAKVNE